MSSNSDDRSTRARIRDAAIECFAQLGTADTTARAVAARADVSAGSVIHHYGSMDDLRVACDAHVVGLIRIAKSDAMTEGPGIDPIAAIRRASGGPPVLAYLARTLTDGSSHVTDLVREMVDDATVYMKAGEESGLLTRLEDPRGSAAMLTIWSLGALVLHEQVKAVLGVDLLGPDLATDPAYLHNYVAPTLDLLSRGVFTPEAGAHLRAALATTDEGRD